MKRYLAILFTVVLLYGCGGGGPQQSELTSHDYSRPAYQSPNYHRNVQLPPS